MIIRATQKKMMSKPVTSTDDGRKVRARMRGQEYTSLLEACRPIETHPMLYEESARQKLQEKIHSATPQRLERGVEPRRRQAPLRAADKTVRLWEVETGRCLRVLEGHTASVLSVAWSPDGRQRPLRAADKTVRLWEVESGRCLRVLEGHTDSVWSVAWSSGRPARPLRVR